MVCRILVNQLDKEVQLVYLPNLLLMGMSYAERLPLNLM